MEDTNSNQNPFRFLDLPFELRSQIIKFLICRNHAQTKTHHDSTQDKISWAEFEIEPTEFTISARGLKSRIFTNSSLFSICRQIRHESLSIIFRDASVCIHVDISRYGGFSKVAPISRPINVLKAYSRLCDLASKVTVIFHPESAHINGPLIVTGEDAPPLRLRENPGLILFLGLTVCTVGPVYNLARLAIWLHTSAPFQRRRIHLRHLVDNVVSNFKSCKSLKVVLYLDDLCVQDLTIILGSFKSPLGSILLEERWVIQGHPDFRHRVVDKYEDEFKKTIDAATREAGHNILLNTPPSSDEYEVSETGYWDKLGCEMIGKRRRVWLDY